MDDLNENESSSFDQEGMRYAQEKLEAAVWKLATGIDGIKARLVDAYTEIAILAKRDFPPDLVEDWNYIRYELTKGKMRYETRVVDGELVEVPVGLLYSTLRYMRKEKAQKIAEDICKLEAKLRFRLDEQDTYNEF